MGASEVLRSDHSGDHWRKVVIPIPLDLEAKSAVSVPAKQYFDGLIQARKAYDQLLCVLGLEIFGTERCPDF